MPRKRPAPVVNDPTGDLDPIELNIVRQTALGDRDHPLHALFTCENSTGAVSKLMDCLTDPDNVNLEDVKRRALSIAGLMQSISMWCDRQHWIITHEQEG